MRGDQEERQHRVWESQQQGRSGHPLLSPIFSVKSEKDHLLRVTWQRRNQRFEERGDSVNYLCVMLCFIQHFQVFVLEQSFVLFKEQFAVVVHFYIKEKVILKDMQLLLIILSLATQKKETIRNQKCFLQISSCHEEVGWGREVLGVWDQQMQTIIYSMNTQQGPTTSHKKPFSASHDKLCGKEYEKIYVCVY